MSLIFFFYFPSLTLGVGVGQEIESYKTTSSRLVVLLTCCLTVLLGHYARVYEWERQQRLMSFVLCWAVYWHRLI